MYCSFQVLKKPWCLAGDTPPIKGMSHQPTTPPPPFMCAASPPILQLIWLFHAAAHISSCWLGSLSYLILQGITQPKRFSISTAVGVIRATDM